MTILLFLVGVSLAMASVGLGAFAWSVRNGQLDDLAAPASAALFDERDDRNDGIHGGRG
jgi:cbb3-type cytochrome oxidase maturation protein